MSAFNLKIYTNDKKLINEVIEDLKKNLKKQQYSYVRLQSKKDVLKIRKNPGGRGYCVYSSWQYKIYRCVVYFNSIKHLKYSQKLSKTPKIFVQTTIL